MCRCEKTHQDVHLGRVRSVAPHIKILKIIELFLGAKPYAIPFTYIILYNFFFFLTSLFVGNYYFTDEKSKAQRVGSLTAAGPGSPSSCVAGPRCEPRVV